MNLSFNEHMQPIGPNSAKFTSRLGMIARCGTRLPLNHETWRKVPKHKKEAVWMEIKTNTDEPDIYKDNCMIKLGEIWRKWKSDVKRDYYTYAPDEVKQNPNLLLRPPSEARVRAEDWVFLVDHWQKEEVKEQATTNKRNCEQNEFHHTSGRTSYANIRHKLFVNGEDTSRPNVFLHTHRKKNGAPAQAIEEMRSQMMSRISQIPESERTTEVIDRIFIEIMGPDGHGRVRTYGYGPSTYDIFGSSSSSTSTRPLSDVLQEMVQSVVDVKVVEIESRRQQDIDAMVDAKDAELESRRQQDIDASVASKVAEMERRREGDILACVQRCLTQFNLPVPRASGTERENELSWDFIINRYLAQVASMQSLRVRSSVGQVQTASSGLRQNIPSSNNVQQDP